MTVTVSLSSKVAINSASCWCLLEYTLHRQVRSRQLPVDTTAAAATTVKSSHNLMHFAYLGWGRDKAARARRKVQHCWQRRLDWRICQIAVAKIQDSETGRKR